MSEKRVEYVERENLRGETVRRFEISFGAGTVRVINVESALNLAKWIYELATENGIENEHARLEAQVETLQKKLAHERGCDECWKEHGKFGTCGSDCLMTDALLEASGER